jgi:hypothetical protein
MASSAELLPDQHVQPATILKQRQDFAPAIAHAILWRITTRTYFQWYVILRLQTAALYLCVRHHVSVACSSLYISCCLLLIASLRHSAIWNGHPDC